MKPDTHTALALVGLNELMNFLTKKFPNHKYGNSTPLIINFLQNEQKVKELSEKLSHIKWKFQSQTEKHYKAIQDAHVQQDLALAKLLAE